MTRFLSLAVFIFVSRTAWGFPELTRAGYNNCAACHVSPSGGGLLTSYGRGLSAEVLSTWGDEKSAGLFWSAADREKLERWILPGGDLRVVQAYQDNDRLKRAMFVKMQAELQLGVVRDHWGLVAATGEFRDQKWVANSRTFYGFWRPRDEFTVQAGRFQPSYGLRLPDHRAFTRSFLGFGLDAIRDTVEAQWTDELWSAVLSHSKQFNVPDAEVANSFQISTFVAQKFKLALNVWRGGSPSSQRTLSGVWGSLGFTKRLYWLTEADYQVLQTQGQDTRAFVSYNRLGYSLVKGLDLIWISEHLHTDLSRHATITNRNGPGLQFYPAPHFEISGAWTRQQSTAQNTGEDYAWLLLHYYL